jgi:hypothetical protein
MVAFGLTVSMRVLLRGGAGGGHVGLRAVAGLPVTGCRAGSGFGGEDLVREISQRFGRSWTLGRPKKEQTSSVASAEPARQAVLF